MLTYLIEGNGAASVPDRRARPNVWHAPCRAGGVRILIYQNPDAGHERPRPDTLIESCNVKATSRVAAHQGAPLTDPDTALDLVVAVGGDGSVGRTAQQLDRRALPIAVLPMGTANNLATVLDAGAHDLAERIAAWTGRARSMPARWRVVRSADWFFEGSVSARSPTRRRGSPSGPEPHPPQPAREAELARDLAALPTQSLTQRADPSSRSSLDGRTIHARLLMLEILNIGLVGPASELAPDADPSDGMLDVVLVEESQPGPAGRGIWRRIGRGTRGAARLPRPSARQGRRVKAAEPATVHIDGRTRRSAPASRCQIGIRRHAVRFLGGPSS